MHFATASTGDTVEKVILSAGDLTVHILTWGATVQDVRLRGVPHSLTLGSDEIADYEGAMCHHGSLIGPVANRIGTARIKLDGMMYELERNQDGRIHLHSGAEAAHRRNWTIAEQTESHVTLTCALRDGACGLPGNRVISVTYRIAAPATLTMDISGTTDATTVMNFANHSFWNLDGSDTWAGHTLQIHADRYLPTDTDNVPTGEITDVTDTPMDFRTPRKMDPATDHFDHNLCLSDTDQPLRDVVMLAGSSGVTLTMATTTPGLQIFDNRSPARPGRQAYEGLVFEAQHWPDAPNNPAFPSITLRPDETYTQKTTWTFSA